MNMTEAELKIFHRYLHNARRYLEFGAGASTLYASQLQTLQKITTVESSMEYVQRELLQDEAVRSSVQRGVLNFHIADIGETKEWGYPKDERSKYLWPNYSLGVFNSDKSYDFVLVDGRFRVACTLASILSTSEDSLICVHDFWNRPEYHIVSKYLNVEDEVETLGVFSKKRSLDLVEIQMLIQYYMFLPGK